MNTEDGHHFHVSTYGRLSPGTKTIVANVILELIACIWPVFRLKKTVFDVIQDSNILEFLF